MCEALKELMAEEFQEVREQVTEQVTGRMTKQFILNAYESIDDFEKVSAILKVPVETVKRTVEERKCKQSHKMKIRIGRYSG